MNAYQLKFSPAVERDRDIPSQNSDRFTNSSPLAAVVREDPNCPTLYADPRYFFNATYLTAELKQLFKETIGILCGQPHSDRHIFPLVGDRDFSETFLCLYHLTKHPQELRQIPQLVSLPTSDSFKVAAFVSFDLDIHTGIEVEPGLRIFTPWGYLAWQLGGTFAYSLVKIHDEQRVAPSEYLLRSFLGDFSTLLLLEDFLDYVEQTVDILGRDAQFSQQLLIFIQNLTAVVEGKSNIVLVYSLPATEDNLMAAIAQRVNPNDRPNQDNDAETGNFASIETSEIPSKIQPSEQKIKQAIAVVSLDEHTYHPRPVSAPKRRQKTRAKIWAAKSDRTKGKIQQIAHPASDRIWAAKSDRTKGKIKQIAHPASERIWAAKSDRTKGKIQQIAHPASDRLRKDTAVPCPYKDGGTAVIPTLYRWHKLSEIDLVIKKLMARSPPQ